MQLTAHSGMRGAGFGGDDGPGGRIVRQKTLAAAVAFDGIGIHCGTKVSVILYPAPPGSGIVFRRSDEGGSALIPARWDRVDSTRFCTTLVGDCGSRVGTVEHLLAALAGCEIDNLVVEVDGPEIPIMDGSAAPFVALIDDAGREEQDAPRRVIRVLKPVSVSDGRGTASLEPGLGFTLRVDIDFENPIVSRQSLSLALVNGTFNKELAPARTFGFLDQIEQMQAAGLARGGSLENAIVVSGDGILNHGGLRFEDEFARHKALDAVGDLYLAGAPIMGAFHGIRSGHEINNKLLRALFADSEAWSEDVLRAGELDHRACESVAHAHVAQLVAAGA